MIQDTGLDRNNIDKFYTKNTIVDKCIKIFKNNILVEGNDIIIEPSAGNGSFLKKLEDEKYNIIGYDIEPEYNNIIKQDFLKLKFKNKNNHFIGNPPFGRQSSLARKFIKLCCKNGKSISFILPKSFKKDSMKKSFDLNFHLIKEIDLEKNSFRINNKDIHVPCIFQIWVKKDYKREKPKKVKPINFKYVKRNENPDLSIRRVGVYAGEINIINDEIIKKSIQSHYFIKLLTINKNEFIKKYKNDFEHNNTVGPKSISKNEINIKLNIILK